MFKFFDLCLKCKIFILYTHSIKKLCFITLADNCTSILKEEYIYMKNTFHFPNFNQYTVGTSDKILSKVDSFSKGNTT